MNNRAFGFKKISLRALIFLCIFSFVGTEFSGLAVASPAAEVLRQKPKKSKSGTKKSKATASSKKKKSKKNTASKSRSKKSRNTARVSASKKGVKRVLSPKIELYQTLVDTVLSPGVEYKHLIIGREKHSVHVVKANITNPAYKFEILKGAGRVDGLERVKDIVARYDSTTNSNVLTAVNANFWSTRALPIGPVVIDGEVVQMGSHKQWSSAFFTPSGQLFIDSFKLKGSIVDKRGVKYPVVSVNYRSDSTGLVLYNAFAGDTIPYVSPLSVDKQLEDMEKNRVETDGDSTEAPLSLDYLRNLLLAERRSKNIESQMTKVQLRYLRSPVVNGKVACQVLAVSAGDVKMPVRGMILSLGKNSTMTIPNEGDTLYMEFTTNYYKNIEFTNAVSGTPRIVRRGVAGHEAYSEGSTAKRFIMHNLARTAIGTDETGENIYLVSIDATGRQEECVGATLSQTAQIMEYLGCYDAMNLDGGGSTTMAIGQDIVTHRNIISMPRKVSVAVAITRKAYMRRGDL
ncbi:MAG TPA: phosphodiester glycosidase family protein [Patescibacteria group bacterium]|nr:phosphodiester glycosidase family protein [Patescibacteria group bacterium]